MFKESAIEIESVTSQGCQCPLLTLCLGAMCLSSTLSLAKLPSKTPEFCVHGALRSYMQMQGRVDAHIMHNTSSHSPAL